MAQDTFLGFPRTPFLTVAEDLPLYRQSQKRGLPRFSPYGDLRIDWIEGNFLRYIV